METLFTVESADDLARDAPPVVDVRQRPYVDAAKAADSPVNLLIRGEPGAGKKTLARWIHQKSGRAGGRLVTIHCATIEPHKIDKALFGSNRTPARGAFPGAFELANGGTVVLSARYSRHPTSMDIRA